MLIWVNSLIQFLHCRVRYTQDQDVFKSKITQFL